MKLELLVAREAFGDIFAETLKDYLIEEFGWSGRIFWGSGYSFRSSALLVNGRINLIYPKTIPVGELRELASEYAYADTLIRRILQMVYVRYAVKFPFRCIFSTDHVRIDPMPPQCKNWCILPGNKSIRIVDLHNNKCVVLKKKGFPIKHFCSTVNHRTAYPEIPGPRILSVDMSRGWYVEDRINGLPLNRVDDQCRKAAAMCSAQTFMLDLYERTSECIRFSDWIAFMTAKLERSLMVLEGRIDNSLITHVRRVATHLCVVCREACDAKSIEIVQSHGDFQAGNILIPSESNAGNVFLIDWEFSERRCRWYDAFVYSLNARSPQGLSERVKLWMRDPDIAYRSVKWCGLTLDLFNLRFLVTCFLIEDLLFRLDEEAEPQIVSPSNEFRAYIRELFSIKSQGFRCDL